MIHKQKLIKFNKQRGIALLFALVILALLLVMAVSFTTDSIFEHKSSYNAANTTAARFLAEAELTKIITMLKDDITIKGRGICWSTNGTANDNLQRLQTMEGGSYVFKWDPAFVNRIKWEDVKINDGVTDRIIGRTAFILVLDPGISPSALVTPTEDESATPYPEKRIGQAVSEINVRSIDSTVIDVTKAKTFNYMAQGGSLAASGLWVDFTNFFSKFAPALTPAEQEDFRKWFVIDPPNDKEAFWVDLNGDGAVDDGTDITKANELFTRFNLMRTDWDAFVTNPNGHPPILKFDIYRDILLDSNGDGTPDITNVFLDTDGDGVPDPGPIVIGSVNWSNVVSNGVGIQWLALLGYNSDGTLDTTQGGTFGNSVAGVVARRRQIAANLVEYCKSPITGIPADSAISDQANWLPPNPAPTFTGNKKTPYIDEIGVALEASVLYTKKKVLVVDDTYNVTVSLNGYLLGKLIDVYNIPPATWGQPFTLKVRGSISYKVTVDGNNLATVVNQPFEFDLPSTLPFTWNGGYGTHVFTFNAATLPASLTSPDITIATTPNPVTVVNGVSVHIDNAILYDATGGFKGYDYSTINKTSTLAVDLLNCDPTTLPALPKSTFFSFQTEDPRQNLNAGDWYVATAAPQVYNDAVGSGIGTSYWKVKWDTPAGSGYTGIVNEKGSPAGGYADALSAASGNVALCEADKEICTDPAGGTMSTAFIRNAPMISPWEIGFIHRGIKWQTINLKKFDKNKVINAINVGGNKYNPGGGNYDLGDANILDQIKMTSAADSPKKIQLKTRMVEALTALLDKVRLGCTPDVTMSIDSMSKTTGTELVSNDIAILVKKIMAKDIVLLSRGELADIPEMSSENSLATKQRDTDAKQEELIGKIINLTDITDKTKNFYGNKIRFFTIVVIAQSIKDVGGVGVDIPINKRKNDAAKTLVPIPSQLGRFDYVLDGGVYYYADDITGEQKIKVRGYRDDTGKVTIFSYEYVE